MGSAYREGWDGKAQPSQRMLKSHSTFKPRSPNIGMEDASSSLMSVTFVTDIIWTVFYEIRYSGFVEDSGWESDRCFTDYPITTKEQAAKAVLLSVQDTEISKFRVKSFGEFDSHRILKMMGNFGGLSILVKKDGKTCLVNDLDPRGPAEREISSRHIAQASARTKSVLAMEPKPVPTPKEWIPPVVRLATRGYKRVYR